MMDGIRVVHTAQYMHELCKRASCPLPASWT